MMLVRKVKEYFRNCIICAKYGIDDPALLELKNATVVEEHHLNLEKDTDYDEVVYPLHASELKDQLFPFVYVEIKPGEELVEDLDNGFEHIPFAFYIPEVPDMLKRKIIEKEILSFATTGDGRLSFEFCYLPDTTFVTDEESYRRDFGNQPGGFALIIWDENGGPEADSYIDFYKEVRAFGLFMQRKIEEYKRIIKKERGIVAA